MITGEWMQALTKQHDLSDQQLIERCRQGRKDAWEEVLTRYQRLVFSIPLNYGLARDDAADISQLTFATLVQHLDRLRPDSNLAGWLSTVARRHALHHLRKRKREILGDEADIGESETFTNLASPDTAERWERVAWLDQGLNLLDKRCRELLLLLYFAEEQPAYEEVAARLGLAVGSIGPIRGRCLDRLRAILVERSG